MYNFMSLYINLSLPDWLVYNFAFYDLVVFFVIFVCFSPFKTFIRVIDAIFMYGRVARCPLTSLL
jgi:hypothetical protein